MYQISMPTPVFLTPQLHLFDPGTFFTVPENKHF